MTEAHHGQYRFPRALRLRTAGEFDAVRAYRLARFAGPLRVAAMPNDLGHHRLGLAVSKRAGNAVKRNAIKRRVREAFRLLQHDLPGAYDLVVSAKSHAIAPMGEYQQWPSDAARRIDSEVQKKANRQEAKKPKPIE